MLIQLTDTDPRVTIDTLGGRPVRVTAIADSVDAANAFCVTHDTQGVIADVTRATMLRDDCAHVEHVIFLADNADLGKRETLVDHARREVAATVKASNDSAHRALDAKYNLIRHSDRRWRVVRVSSVAETMFGISDVVTFEYVSAPLSFDDARRVLADKRGAGFEGPR